MNNPWHRLRWLPWRSLILVSVLTIALAAVLDFLLIQGLTQSAIVRSALVFLLSPPWSLLAIAATGVGIGALAVLLFERLPKQVLIDTSTLWALILCLILGLGLKSLFPLARILTGLNYTQVIGILVGVFWKGRHYWRWR